MTLPKIELRGISHNERMSEETNCFTAKMYVDGVYLCDVSNHGHGGCDMHSPTKASPADFHDRIRALAETVKRDFPKIDVSYMHGKPAGTEMMESDLDIVVGELLSAYLVERDMKRALSRKVLFVKDDGNIYEIKCPAKDPRRAELITRMKAKPDVRAVLNDLSDEEALAHWKRVAA